MHSLTCARNNWYCVECDRPFPKSERDEHMKTVHAPFACDVCGDTVQVRLSLSIVISPFPTPSVSFLSLSSSFLSFSSPFFFLSFLSLL